MKIFLVLLSLILVVSCEVEISVYFVASDVRPTCGDDSYLMWKQVLMEDGKCRKSDGCGQDPTSVSSYFCYSQLVWEEPTLNYTIYSFLDCNDHYMGTCRFTIGECRTCSGLPGVDSTGWITGRTV